MGVMLRLAGVPSRVVIGYTHRSADADGRFPVTSYDAHAWVEAYFPAAGWIPFDPTPLGGADAPRASVLLWAPHPGQTVAPSENTTAPRISLSGGPNAAQGASANRSLTANTSSGPGWVVWLVVALAVLIAIAALLPAAVRVKRRRARLRSARAGPDPLWAELADTAVDLGYVWSPVRSPRQVEGWLRHEGVTGADAEGALHSLAVAVERSRYAPPGRAVTATDLVADLREVEASLRARRGRRDRVRARILPASVSWLRRALHRH
jgi:Transglutaminase-like superfamily